MTLENQPQVPPRENEFDSPRGVIRGSVQKLPGDSKPRATSKLSAGELAGRSVTLRDRVNGFIAYLETLDARLAERRVSVEEANSDLPSSLRLERVRTAMRTHRRSLVTETEEQRGLLLADIHALAAECELMRPFWHSPVRVLQSHAWSVAGRQVMPSLMGAGVAAILSAYEDAYAGVGGPALGGCLVSAVNALPDDDKKALAAHGVDLDALAMQLVGADFTLATEALESAVLARMEAEAAHRAFQDGTPLGDAVDNLAIGRRPDPQPLPRPLSPCADRTGPA